MCSRSREERIAVKLGIRYKTKKSVAFTTWAPMAKSVQLLLFKNQHELNEPDLILNMSCRKNGVWQVKADCSEYNFYKYRILNRLPDNLVGKMDCVNDVADIWHTVASGDSVASQIATPDDSSAIPELWEWDYYNPFAKSNNNYTRAVIYEMHVVDWGRAVGGDGKFLDLADSKKIIDHLKDLGITHVQLLPVFDYAQKNNDPAYNWGYNPYHYNVPEGRYVTSGYDKTDECGLVAVREFRHLVNSLHNAGIAVNMDVVYNHTDGTGNYSLYDKTVPGYFYRFNDSGNYSNGSGCSNEIATNNPMVKAYVINSLKHWMLDYHVNGFRFDLMGVHEISTMKEIYAELKKIDPYVMVYGEPWCGGPCLVQNGCTKENIDMADGVACFNDNFRDSIKGAEFGGFQRGQVNGCYYDSGICCGLVGSVANDSVTLEKQEVAQKEKAVYFTEHFGHSINYVECHDNYTLYDKLNISLSPDASGEDCVKYYVPQERLFSCDSLFIQAQSKLSAAYVILAQGTPFLNGGQEFMRTKLGNPDSYSSDTKGGHYWSEEEIAVCNTVDFSLKEKNRSVYNTYKGLIAFRKENARWFGSNRNAQAKTISPGITKYTAGPYTILFNASKNQLSIDSGCWKNAVEVGSGSPIVTSVPKAVEPMSFIILFA